MNKPPILAIQGAAHDHGARVALIDADGVSTTWHVLHGLVLHVARALDREAAAAGMGPGDLFAFVARPDRTTFVLLHALIACGRPFLPIHPRLTPPEVTALRDAVGVASWLDEKWIEVVVHMANAPPPPGGLYAPPAPPPIPDDERTLAVLASSGTTGTPKGVVLSRRAFSASARASHVNLPLAPTSRWIACMPFAHAGGLSILTRALAARSAVVLLPRFDAAEVARVAAASSATHLSVVPTMLRALLDAGGAALGPLDAILVGGASCPDSMLDEARRRGIPALATYGLTEACSQVTTQPLGDRSRAADGDSGIALPGTEVAILDQAGARLGANREGLIAVRGPTLAWGYRGGAARDPGAWLETGDFGVQRDDGRLVVLARRTDLIVTGGENAYPAEIESVLRGLVGVRDCAVVGVTDDRWGEVVGVVVELEPGRALEEVLSPSAHLLAPHRMPRCAVTASAPLPRTSKGEVDRAAVRARYAASLASARLSSSGIGVGRNDVPSTTT